MKRVQPQGFGEGRGGEGLQRRKEETARIIVKDFTVVVELPSCAKVDIFRFSVQLQGAKGAGGRSTRAFGFRVGQRRL